MFRRHKNSNDEGLREHARELRRARSTYDVRRLLEALGEGVIDELSDGKVE